MPLKLNVGLSRKIGEQNYGSRGAAVNLELELESSLVNDPQRLHGQIRQLFGMAKAAVEEELNGGGQPDAAAHDNGQQRQRQPPTQPTADNTNGHRATGKQIEYIARLAGQIPGMDPQRLDALSEKMFEKPLSGLNSFEASGLIDCLKSIKSGEIDVEKAPRGAAT